MKLSTGITIQFLFVFVFFGQIFPQYPTNFIATQESVADSVKLAPCKSEERLEAVKNLFVKAGAKPEEIIVEKFNKDRITNVVVTKKGKTEENIIIGAHYDKTSEGCGAVDNWTGISVIAHLFGSLSKIDTEKTLIFVAFDQEELGLLGSDAMAKNIAKENRKQYCSMINFDSFGFSSPFILANSSAGKLVDYVEKFAKSKEFKIARVTIDGADADSTSFKSRDIPAITLSGLDNNWQKILHSSNDKLEKINMASVYLGYRFGLALLVDLDANVCRETKN